MYVEEICLSEPVDDAAVDHQLEEQETVALLEQVNRMRRSHSLFTLFSNHRLSVETCEFMKTARSYTIDIGILDPQPKRSLKVRWDCFLLSLMLCAISLGSLSGVILSGNTLLTVVTGGGAVLSLILALYGSHDRIVFYSQHGRVPLIILFRRLPDRRALQSFTDVLAEHIAESGADRIRSNERLNAELREHRRLMEEGVISARRYDIAKQRILGQHC